jgi:hypothetical protein
VETPRKKENLIDFEDTAPVLGSPSPDRSSTDPPKRINVDPDDEPMFIK